ncbi:MAG: DUF962 domain-containing protein [Alphaproteobacteria bacterium]|nr:DUF962 domain-containing protein [Alphaproteobacteria bacterium]
MAEETIDRYHEFWPSYLRERRKPTTRVLHYLGMTLAIAFLVTLHVTGEAWYLLVAIASGYFFAMVTHFFVERNKPATFRYLSWSIASDFSMYFLGISGRL